MNKKYFFLLLLSLFFLKGDCHEDLNNIESTPSKKAKIEYDYIGLQSSDDRWNRISTEETFAPADVKIEKASTVEMLTPVIFYFYSTNTDCQNLQTLENYASIHRTENITTYPIYLMLSNATLVENGEISDYVGLSNNSRLTDCSNLSRNWSFAWFGNIINHNPGLNYQSLLNRTIAHELLHQVGNVWGDDAHCNHNEDCTNCNKCVIWGLINEGYNFTQALTEFEICPRHGTSLKNGPDLITDQPFTPDIPGISGNQNINVCGPPCGPPCPPSNLSESDLKISLAKKTYKLHEPILVMFEYVNNNFYLDTIRSDFKDQRNETSFLVEGENGKNYNKRNHTPLTLRGDYINTARYYLPPKDTFIASMTLNYRYGEETKGKENYFDLYGYLEPGKYKVTAKTRFNGKEYVSNKEEFEIAGLSSEDETVLVLIKNKNINDLLENFSENPFTEHVLVKEIGSRHGFYDDSNPPNREETINDYKIFFDKFPNSYYNIESRVLDPFFGRLAHSSEHFLEDIENIKNQYPGTLLYRILNKEYFVKGYYERFKKSQEFKKELDKKYKKK